MELRFSVRGFGYAPFLYAYRGIYGQEYSKKDNRCYRRRAYTRRAWCLSWQWGARVWVLLRWVRLPYALFLRILSGKQWRKILLWVKIVFDNRIVTTKEKAPLCKGSCRKATEGLFCRKFNLLQSLRHANSCHLPLHKGGSLSTIWQLRKKDRDDFTFSVLLLSVVNVFCSNQKVRTVSNFFIKALLWYPLLSAPRDISAARQIRFYSPTVLPCSSCMPLLHMQPERTRWIRGLSQA